MMLPKIYKVGPDDGRRARWERMTPEQRSAHVRARRSTPERCAIPAAVMVAVRGHLKQIDQLFEVEPTNQKPQ